MFYHNKNTPKPLTFQSNNHYPDEELKCHSCNGHYVIRQGKYNAFAGCSNFLSKGCRSTLKLHELAYEVLKRNGIYIYKWQRQCWKCHNITPIYTYFLNQDLVDYDPDFEPYVLLNGLGDFPTLDNYLSIHYPTIKLSYSRTVGQKYMANTCQCCGALQGRNYVVEDPHEIFSDWVNYDLSKYIVRTIPFYKTGLTLNDISHIIDDSI